MRTFNIYKGVKGGKMVDPELFTKVLCVVASISFACSFGIFVVLMASEELFIEDKKRTQVIILFVFMLFIALASVGGLLAKAIGWIG